MKNNNYTKLTSVKFLIIIASFILSTLANAADYRFIFNKKDTPSDGLLEVLKANEKQSIISAYIIINTWQDFEVDQNFRSRPTGYVDVSPEKVQNSLVNRFKLSIDPTKTLLFLGGYTAYYVTGKAESLVAAINRFSMGGEVVWAGLENPEQAYKKFTKDCARAIRAYETSW